MISLIVIGLTTRENVSWKSKPWTWWKPLATNRALYLLMDPSAFSLIRKTHLHPIVFLLEGKGTKSQVWFFSKAAYSSCMAESQFGLVRACLTPFGSLWAKNNEWWIRGVCIPDLDLVCIGWALVVLETGSPCSLDSRGDEESDSSCDTDVGLVSLLWRLLFEDKIGHCSETTTEMGEKIESWCVGVGEVKGELWQGGDKSGVRVKYWEKEVAWVGLCLKRTLYGNLISLKMKYLGRWIA